MIDHSVPGQQHYARCRAAYLLGGYIAGGMLSYDEAYTALEAAVRRTAQQVPVTMRTVCDGLQAGAAQPITYEQLEAERQAYLATHWHTRAKWCAGQLPTIAAEEIPPWH
jgi:hypothetical protein